MISLYTKRKLLIIGICILMVGLSSTLFIFGENKFDHNDLQAFVLHEEEIETAQTEDFYRDFVENHDEPLLILKKDAMIHFASGDLIKSLNSSIEDLASKNFFNLVHPKDLPFFANSMINLMDKGEEINNIGPFRVQTSEGRYRLFMANAMPLWDEENQIIQIALKLQDITVTEEEPDVETDSL